jgi:uncharacterized protein YbjT (DUF2867 family)
VGAWAGRRDDRAAFRQLHEDRSCEHRPSPIAGGAGAGLEQDRLTLALCMRVAVIGATGGVGQELVRELLGPNSPAVTVRAVVRDPAAGATLWSCGTGCSGNCRLELAQGDVTQPETVAAALTGMDVVIMAHSRRFGEESASAELVDYGGTAAVCKAASAAGVSKLVYVSSNSVNRPDKMMVQLINWMGGMGLAWKLKAEAAVRSSGIPYVIVRPVGLKDDRSPARSTRAVVSIQQTDFGLGTVTRAAVANLCVRALVEAPRNTTLHCSGGSSAACAARDIGSAFASLVPDARRSVLEASFEQHEAATRALAWKVRLGLLGALGLAVTVSGILRRR